ncbi:hypothetical protein Hanom_Chr09g00789171 [Helianthus anomalus]
MIPRYSFGLCRLVAGRRSGERRDVACGSLSGCFFYLRDKAGDPSPVSYPRPPVQQIFRKKSTRSTNQNMLSC